MSQVAVVTMVRGASGVGSNHTSPVTMSLRRYPVTWDPCSIIPVWNNADPTCEVAAVDRILIVDSDCGWVK